jgi:ssDNA-specific exonuclease RecJ
MWRHVMWCKYTDISDKHTASIFSDTLKLDEECLSEMSVDFTSLHSVTSKKSVLFLVTTVKTSDLNDSDVCKKILAI